VIVDIGLSAALCRDRSIGSQVADAALRSDNLLTGITLQYSLPYLQSKVRIFSNTLSTVLDPRDKPSNAEERPCEAGRVSEHAPR
jgi:hypothetical protein